MTKTIEELPREMCMGSTDTNAAIGTNRHKGRNELYCAKTGLPRKPSPGMEISLHTEDALRTLTQIKLAAAGIDVCIKPGKTFYMHEDGVDFRTTPDGLAVASTRHRRVLYTVELKNAFRASREDYGEEWSEDVREDYFDQCVQHCALTPGNPPACLLSVWFDPYQWPELFIVKANPQRWEELKAAGKAFWHNHVVPRIPPDVDETAWCRRAQLRRQGWEDKGREAEPAERQALVGIQKKTAAMKELEKEIDKLKNTIAKSANGHERLEYMGKKVISFKANKNGVRSIKLSYNNFSDMGQTQ